MKKEEVQKSTEEEKRLKDLIPVEIKMIFSRFSELVEMGKLGKGDFKIFINKFYQLYLEKKGVKLREDQVEEFM